MNASRNPLATHASPFWYTDTAMFVSCESSDMHYLWACSVERTFKWARGELRAFSQHN